jgi:D-alanine--poly(phosphoribitol) ligase subunit 2
MSAIEIWLLEWFATRKGFDKGTPSERLPVDYFSAKLVDSFDVLELVGDVEARFGVRFEDRHFQDRRFTTIGGLARIVDELCGPREEAA